MLRGLSGVLAGTGRGMLGQYGAAMVALAGGILLFLVVDYAILFATGRLPTGFDPLTTVIAIQFVPLLALVAVIATFCWRRMANPLPAALICGGLVTWYAVAGTATQVV
jgi:predicted Co/Zn/Cd cation transporter (cation efflux family)